MSESAKTILGIIGQDGDLQRAAHQHPHFHVLVGLCRQAQDASDAEFLIALTRMLAAWAADLHGLTDHLAELAARVPSGRVVANLHEPPGR